MPATLPGDPIGWFAVAFSHELRPGDIASRTLCGHDIVLFRTAAGRLAAMDAHCPHLGAHLGQGRIDGETVVCPFHGFAFSTSGECVSTPYDGKPPPTCRNRSWALRETDGLVLVWHHPGGVGPTFEVPDPEADGWLTPRTGMFALPVHPQETSENSVDLGHFTSVHGYVETELCGGPDIDGPHLKMSYRLARAGFGLSRAAVNRVTFDAHLFGLGVSRVDVYEAQRDLHLRLWVLCTPTRDGNAELRIGAAMKAMTSPGRAHPMLALLPRGAANRLVQTMAFRELARDVSDDFEIWSSKAYLDRPALAKGDGPIGRYRRWCRQFYVDAA